MRSDRRKEREREFRRSQILDAARKVFSHKSFNQATMEEIAEKADYSPATLYLYFKNKQDLYTSLAHGLLQKLAEDFEVLADEKDLGPLEKLRQSADLLYSGYEHDPVTLGNLFRLQAGAELADMTLEMAEKLNGEAKRVLHSLAGMYKDGYSQGFFRHVHPMAVADSFWAIFAGLVLWEESKRYFDPGKKFLKSTLYTALEIFLDGLAVKPGKK